MPCSKVGVATRAVVNVLLALARAYELVLNVNRDSPRECLVKAYKKLLLKAHPDKGGRKEDVQKLQKAQEDWERSLKGCAPKGGRPLAKAADGAIVSQTQGNSRKDFRVHASVVLQGLRKIARGQHPKIALGK